jgi:hypothetical protein
MYLGREQYREECHCGGSRNVKQKRRLRADCRACDACDGPYRPDARMKRSAFSPVIAFFVIMLHDFVSDVTVANRHTTLRPHKGSSIAKFLPGPHPS